MTKTPDTPEPSRRRAPGMNTDQRRAMIIQATLPLIAEHGAAITTSKIAAAAGIGEATIFRVFKDKEELLDACLAEALRPDGALAAIAEIPLDISLHERLIEAAGALEAHVGRMGRVLGAMHASGHRAGPRRGAPADGEAPRRGGESRTAGIDQTREALAALFEPEKAGLRLPPEDLASVLLDLLFARSRGASGSREPVCIASLIHLFLHGAFDMSKIPAEYGGEA
ncbi:TetR/AcrR family transcriptional regulator [Amycolatopsis sp. cg5]|uniref:TetR/AcrR family transcriptional regulator n=1 Tax=Amycolatopsis sp. cg5 TaxID=3238802 RepID=UPI003524D53E